MSSITVSIFILTFNQESFISQTIESILSQKADFNYQLVIGEDCSTDATRIICERYAEKFRDKIKLLPKLEKNIGLIRNYLRTIKECDGKYVTICDGDDYWIDDFKLQKQVNFLEKNLNFSIVYTSIELLYKDGRRKLWKPITEKTETNFDDLIFQNHIPSVSVMFKNRQSDDNEIPSWIKNYPFGDWQTYLWTIKDGGKIRYLADVTAVYRIDAGISSEIRRIDSNILNINLNILADVFEDPNFSSKRSVIYKARRRLSENLVVSYNREHSYYKAGLVFLKNCKNHGIRFKDIKMYFYSIIKSLK